MKATLIKGKSYIIGNMTFIQGVEMPVNSLMAEHLRSTGLFSIKDGPVPEIQVESEKEEIVIDTMTRVPIGGSSEDQPVQKFITTIPKPPKAPKKVGGAIEVADLKKYEE